MHILLININAQKEIFHKYDFSVYTPSKYLDLKLDTYRRTTNISLFLEARFKTLDDQAR